MHTRAILYCLALCALLGAATILMFRSPGQVRSAIERRLAAWLHVPVRVEGAEHPLFGELRIANVVVPAAPVLGERSVLTLREVCEREPGQIEIAEGELVLEYEEPAAFSVAPGKWNIAQVLRAGAAGEALRGISSVHVGTLDVTARRRVRATNPLEWNVSARELIVRPDREEGAVTLSARFYPDESWQAGRCELRWDGGSELELRAMLEGVSDAHAWLPLFSDDARALWARLEPEGEVDVDLTRLRISSGTVREVEGTVLAYGVTARVEGLGAELSGVRGPMRIHSTGVEFGRSRTGDVLRGRVRGIDVEIDGELSAGGGSLELAVPRQKVERFARGAETARGWWGRFFASHVASGQLEGGLSLSLTRRVAPAGDSSEPQDPSDPAPSALASPALRGTLRLESIVLPAIPCLGEIRGDLVLDATGARGSARLGLDDTVLPRVGLLDGEVRSTWDDTGLSVRATDLEVAGAGGQAGSLAVDWRIEFDAAATSPGERSVRDEELALRTRGEVKWFDLNVTTGLGTFRGVRGSLTLRAPPEEDQGDAECAAATLPADLVGGGPEELELDRGNLRFRLSAAAAFVEALALRGREHDVRCRGEIRFDGTLSLVCVVAKAGRPDFRDSALDLESLERWRVAAGEGSSAHLIAGTLDRPHARPIDPAHPAFAETPRPAGTSQPDRR